jgi:hypothetical protein
MNRAALVERFDAVEHRMDSIEHRLDVSFAALSTQSVQSHRETRDEITATLRGEMGALGEALRAEAQETSATLRGEMRMMGGDLHDEMYALHGLTNDRFDKLEAAVAETRRFMLILHEEVLSRIALIGEGHRN